MAALLVLVAHLAASPGQAAPRGDADLARRVSPFIGTDGTGHVFPGATRPFGMVAPSPDTGDRGWSYSGGYQFRDTQVLGFSNTHISGAGIPELGDVLLLPSQKLNWGAATTDFRARIDKTQEAASPGHYRVALPGHGVTVELTATQRVAFHRYQFHRPLAKRVQVLVDLQHGLLFGEGPRVTQASSHVDAARGEVAGTVHSRNWVERQASFVLQFDRPIVEVATLPPRQDERAARYVLSFDMPPGGVLQARVALSTVDEAGARRNLALDAGRSFRQVQREARAEWNALLARIRIQAPPRQQRIFYSALYRTLLHPSDIADADGRVRGPTGQVSVARGGRYYSTFSLWDTFRGVHPLHTLLVPERVDGFVLSLLDHHRAQGYLPLWTAWGRETHTMIANPALPVLADAIAKGHRGFPLAEALQAMVQTSTAPRPNAPPWAQRDWAALEQFGYIPSDRIAGESVSLTAEIGIGDDAVARVATLAGDAATAARFARRAQGWRQLWDAQTQTLRGRDSTGQWRTPFDPDRATSPMNNPGDYTEANAWQYTPTPALHDPLGWVQTLGGPAAAEAWLDRFFSAPVAQPDKHLGQEALIGHYAHGNEPSHHIAYLYAHTPAPWKGHALLRRIATQFYGDGPDGIIGNDDCGQMSAWLVLTTLGLYPAVPASGQWTLGAPQVRAATLALPGGRQLAIRAAGFGPTRPWAQAATLRGQPVAPTALPHSALLQGGALVYQMKELPP